MRSCSESIYRIKVTNAEKLLILLKENSLYLPENCKALISELETTITIIKTQNTAVHLKKQLYSDAVENLKRIFIKRDDAIRKRLSGIGVFIKKCFGKTSREALSISDSISQIRGANRIHNVGNSSIENNINQAYLSYTSQIQLFSSVITSLENLKNTYTPFDETLSILALKAIKKEATQANDTVITIYSEYLLLKNSRAKACTRLSELTQEIKSMVKATSTIRKTEFRLIKNLKI
ncbi:MAG: hypothetical protein E2604_02565 [Flavobacterium sp.]|jgi:hypothetical protein|nr:hypothetical protein [Flavobacterium sp.]HRB71643.1 hypothetical protein [Flavobacterium sp.]